MSRLRMLMEGQGDPGLFDIVRRLGSQAIRTFVPGGSTALALAGALRPGQAGLGLVPRAIGQGGLRAAGPGSREALLRQLQPRQLQPQPVGRILPAFPPIAFRRATPAPGVAGVRRRRRMNPTNFRALQRGLRRLKAFAKLARMVIKSEARFKAPRKRGGFGRKR